MLVDSHVNLHGEKFSCDIDDVISRARLAGVSTMLNIACKVSNFDNVISVAEKDPNIWASVGTHPHYADENEIQVENLKNNGVKWSGIFLFCIWSAICSNIFAPEA